MIFDESGDAVYAVTGSVSRWTGPGLRFADTTTMTRRRENDRHPGPLPEIRSVGDSVVFEFDPTSVDQGARLVIRCDENGNVLARITSVAEHATGSPW